MINIDDLDIKKKRTLEYFLSAVKKIIDEEGFESVTIRKVAEIAGYNSATLYSYFDNLDHLLYWASMTHLDEYIENIPKYIDGLEDPCEIYLAIWYCYADYCYKNPDIYYYLFFSPLNKRNETWARAYYKIFPIKNMDFPEQVDTMLNASNINRRSYSLIKPCVEEGYLTEQSARDIDTLIIAIFSYKLNLVRNNIISREQGLEDTFYYIDKIFNKFKNR